MELDGNKPGIIFSLKAYQQMCAYVDLCEGEVQWFFDVDWSGDKGSFVVGKIYLLEQEASAAHIESDEEIVHKFMDKLMADSPNLEQMPRGWGHSHVDMDAFFSSVDEDTIDQLANDSFSFSIVMNKGRKYSNCLKIATPFFSVRFDNIPLSIDYTTAKIPQVWQDEVKDKVKTKSLSKAYLDFWKNAKKNLVKAHGVLELPKNRQDALFRITNLDLIRTWNNETKEVFWKNPKSGQLWKDKWGVLDEEALEFMELINKKDTDKQDIKKARALVKKMDDDWEDMGMGGSFLRCTKCYYSRQWHDNSPSCDQPVYEVYNHGVES